MGRVGSHYGGVCGMGGGVTFAYVDHMCHNSIFWGEAGAPISPARSRWRPKGILGLVRVPRLSRSASTAAAYQTGAYREKTQPPCHGSANNDGACGRR